MLNEQELPPLSRESREEAFTQRYPQLLAWALRLTNQQRAHAEDLVQDAFIQFTRARTSLADIENIDGYLRRMLRNMNLSRLSRTAELMYERTISIAEEELLQLASDVPELQRHLQTREELHRICDYACKRKESSRAGSVLILRFFLEYSPVEISHVLCCSRHCVDQWQRFARRELKLYLEHPTRLKFVTPKTVTPQLPSRNDGLGLAEELREIVFQSCTGDCIERTELQQIYRSGNEEILTSEKVAHLVSCANCLDEVNRILSLPLLSERFQPEPPASRPTPPKSSGGGSAGGPTDLSARFAKRISEVVDDEPKELRLSVNSTPVGSLIVSESNELLLNLTEDEPIEFIEIFSDRGVRLLFFTIPEVGLAESNHWAEIELHDHRVLRASLEFHNGQRTFRVHYSRALVEISAVSKNNPRARLAEWISTRTTSWWFKPGLAMAVVAAIVLGTTLFWSPTTTGPELLKRAGKQENSIVAVSSKDILHRTIILEERDKNGRVISRQRIESWLDKARNRSARRVYDETNQLVSGVWEQDGSRNVYHHGAPLLHDQSAPRLESMLDEDAWMLELSATQFNSLVGEVGNIQALETESTYTIHWNADDDRSPLIMAALTLSKPALGPVKLVLQVKRGGVIVEYQFTETAGELVNEGNVPASVFSSAEVSSSVPRTTKEESVKQPLPRLASRSRVASVELEIELEQLLFQAKGDRSEQIALVRESNGCLLIDGVVDTAQRKDELLNALVSVRNNPLVKIRLQTVNETRSSSAAERRVIRASEATPDLIPMDRAIREYFARVRKLSSDGELDAAVRNYSSGVVNQAYRALFHAIELDRIVNRFSDAQLQTIAPDARFKWLQLMRNHVRAFERETNNLVSDLALVLSSESERTVTYENPITNYSQLRLAVERLRRTALTTNSAIGAAFTISAQGSSAAVKSKEFWRSLLISKQLAEQITQYED